MERSIQFFSLDSSLTFTELYSIYSLMESLYEKYKKQLINPISIVSFTALSCASLHHSTTAKMFKHAASRFSYDHNNISCHLCKIIHLMSTYIICKRFFSEELQAICEWVLMLLAVCVEFVVPYFFCCLGNYVSL